MSTSEFHDFIVFFSEDCQYYLQHLFFLVPGSFSTTAQSADSGKHFTGHIIIEASVV